ncbi:MAG: nitroreductase family protein [Anaerolineae bacterium]|nr:nitroreductase family protein [Anaerolineae bacterium]
MNETLEMLWKRRSIRKYKPEPIPEEDLHLILEAARRAPTGGNRQNWKMIVVTDPEMRRKTAEACSGQMWMADAAVILCIVALPGESKVSGTIVLDHAILAATSLGYGSCWIGSRDAAKAVLGIPDDHDIICLAPMGVPDEQPEARPRKLRDVLFTQNGFETPLDYEL